MVSANYASNNWPLTDVFCFLFYFLVLLFITLGTFNTLFQIVSLKLGYFSLHEMPDMLRASIDDCRRVIDDFGRVVDDCGKVVEPM